MLKARKILNQLLSYRHNEVIKTAFYMALASFLLQLFTFNKTGLAKLIIPLLLYFSLITLLKPRFAALFVLLLEGFLLRIHILKVSQTNTSLVATDLMNLKQAFAVSSYVNPGIMFVGVGLVLVAIWTLLKGLNFRLRYFPFVLCTALIISLEHSGGDNIKKNIDKVYAAAGVTYAIWDFKYNVEDNGILTHLVQTLSTSYLPPKGPHSFYQQNPPARSDNAKLLDKTDVFLILCESCYTSKDDRFKTPLAYLKDLGFQFTSVISPVYGGGTAEAEFEVLTGLPSTNLPGIKYQYYGDRFRFNSSTLISNFNANGYQSLALHNYHSFFWRRKDVYPGFGFEHSYFIDEMNWPGKGLPPDQLLYDKAFEQYSLRSRSHKPLFFFLATMSSHGPYEEIQNDGGKAAYFAKMESTVGYFKNFYAQVLAESQRQGRSVVFILFGDHKPAVTPALFYSGVLDQTYFKDADPHSAQFRFGELSAKQKISLGEVPLLIGGNSPVIKEIQNHLLSQVTDKPLFCLPAVISNEQSLSSDYLRSLSSLCDRHSAEDMINPPSIKGMFPRELYSELLF